MWDARARVGPTAKKFERTILLLLAGTFVALGKSNASSIDGNASRPCPENGRFDGVGLAFCPRKRRLRTVVGVRDAVGASPADVSGRGQRGHTGQSRRRPRELAHVEVVGFSGAALEASDWLAVHSGEWDLAVVDLFLTEGSGLTVLAACSVRDPDQKVAVLSNYATRDMRSRCAAFGADAVFDNSTELDEFIEFCLDRSI